MLADISTVTPARPIKATMDSRTIDLDQIAGSGDVVFIRGARDPGFSGRAGRARSRSWEIAMKGHLWVVAVAAAFATGAVVAVPRMSWAQTAEAGPGIVTSVSGSAAVSTKGMSPGSEIWAVWYSLPPGKTVVESATTTKWLWFEMALGGSAVVNGGPTPMCRPLSAGGRQAAGTERVSEAGDVEVCNYAILPESRTENRGTQPYVFAGLAVGGPWKEDMEDDVDLYLKVNGLAKAAHITSSKFSEVEREILAAGAITVGIRNITMPPGAQIVTTDQYPTLRMVESGRLILSAAPKGSSGGTRKTLAALEMAEWVPTKAGDQIVLSNNGDQPVQFVEWTVAPAPGIKP